MILTPRNFLLAGVSFALVACAAPSTSNSNVQADAPASVASEAPTTSLGPAISTIKPGASVSFSHETSGPLVIDGNGYVTISVNEGYPSGVLSLQASADEGVEVYGPGASHSVNMASGTTHSWRVDYRGLTDGVHYLNIHATAQPSENHSETRAYAVRVEVGDWQAAKAQLDAAKPMAVQPDGELMIIMDAEETIE